MIKKLGKICPPGIDVKKELLFYGGAALLFIVLFSMSFLLDLGNILENRIFYTHLGQRLIRPGAVMPGFGEMMVHRFMAYWSYLCLCLGMAAGHYRYFSASHSVYVMKRIRDPRELHRRCLELPLIAAAVGLVLVIILTGVYRAVYLAKVPAVCLPARDVFDFWRLLIW